MLGARWWWHNIPLIPALDTDRQNSEFEASLIYTVSSAWPELYIESLSKKKKSIINFKYIYNNEIIFRE